MKAFIATLACLASAPVSVRAGGTAREAPVGGAAAAPFTRATVLAEVVARYPGVTLPPEALPPGVGAAEDVVFARIGDTALALDLYRLESGGPFPAVLIVHGGGWEAGDRRMERPLALRLAALSYVAVPVDYRLGAAGRFPAALDDLKSAVRWLRAHAGDWRIDPARIAAVGASSGGQLVALLGATNGMPAFEGAVGERGASSAVQAVVDVDGLADFTELAFVAAQAAHPSAPTRFLGGTYRERSAVWREASALTHVGPASAPTLFLNSTAPAPVLPGRPEMRDRLRALGIDAEIVVFPDTPHPFWLVQPWFERVVAEIDHFLRRELPRPARPAP